METKKNKHDRLRQDAWNKALFSYGYGYLFSHRASKLKTRLNWITFLGIIVPILIGGIVTTYGITSPILKYLLIITAPISITQLVISVWSIVANWNTSYAYYLESYLDNYSLADKYEDLGKYPPEENDELKSKLDKIDVLRSSRDKQDSKYPLTDKEKRKGMRYSLRKFKRECAGCKKIPTDMKSTKCGVCGNF